MGRSTPPLCWFGSKHDAAIKIYKFLPPHTTYVEVFGGGGALLFFKPPSRIEVYNDINGDLVSFFRVLQDREKFQELMHRLTFTLYSRQEYEDALRTIRTETDEIERARKFFILSKMAPAQRFAHPRWGFVVRDASSFPPANVKKWLSTLMHLERFHSRLASVQIEHGDFREILDRYDYSEACFYLDPPYLKNTMNKPRFINPSRPYSEYNAFSEKDALDLIERLLKLKGKAVLTVQPHEIYKPLESRYTVAELFPEGKKKLRLLIYYSK